MAKSGETVFIAGLIQDQKKNTSEMVPCLGNAPGLGWLFRGTSRSTGKNELVVLITPQVFENDRKRLDKEAIEKTKKVEEELKKGPQPPYQEFFYLPWE
jgi:general secretion pathway protein D